MPETTVATGLAFPEGPAIGPDGELYVVEIAGGRVSRVGRDGAVSTFAETGGGPNGCAFGPDGHLYVCNNGGNWPGDVPSTAGAPKPPGGAGAIQRVAPDGSRHDLSRRASTAPRCTSRTTSASTTPAASTSPTRSGPRRGVEPVPSRVLYCDASGAASVSHSGLAFPNGLGVTGDGRFLVVCESMTGMLWSFKIEGPGVLGEAKPNGHIGRRSVPDGFCFDSDGNMIVAGHGTNCLFVLSGGDGRPVRVVELADAGPTNACFGGSDLTTLYVTSSDVGAVLALEWPVPGMQLFPDR